MNIRTKVTIFMLIGINIGCSGIDMLIEESKGWLKITVDYHDNKNSYTINFTKRPSTKDKALHSISLNNIDTGNIRIGEIDSDLLTNAFQTPITQLLSQEQEIIMGIKSRKFKEVEKREPPDALINLYEELTTLIKEKFPDFKPISLQVSAQEALSLPPATHIQISHMQIDQPTNNVFIEYASPKGPIAISNRAVKNESILTYQVKIYKEAKRILVLTDVTIFENFPDDPTFETIIKIISDKPEFADLKRNGMHIDQIQTKPWLAYLYNYIANFLRKKNIFSQVALITIPENELKTIEQEIASKGQSAHLGISQISQKTPKEVSPLSKDSSFMSRWLPNPIYRNALEFKQNYITPITKALWSTQARRAATLGTLGTIGASAATYLYYLYAKPSK